VADDELREAERAWGRDPADRATLARLAAARLRAGLPVTHDLVETFAHPARMVHVPAPMEVFFEPPGPSAFREYPDRGAHGGFDVPEHSVLGLRGDTAEALLAAARQPGITALELLLSKGTDPDSLRALVDLPLTHLSLGLPDGVDTRWTTLVASMPRLAELELLSRVPPTPDALEPLSRARALSSLALRSVHVPPSVLGPIGRLPELQRLELSEDVAGDGRSATETVRADGAFAGLARSSKLTSLVLSRARSWDLRDADLQPLSALTRLETLELPVGRYGDATVRSLARLPLSTLRLHSRRFLSSAAGPVLAAMPLRHLDLDRVSLGLLRQLPAELESLTVDAPRSGELAWLQRCRALHELCLDLRRSSPGELAHVAVLPRLRELDLTFGGLRADDELSDEAEEQLGHLDGSTIERLVLRYVDLGVLADGWILANLGLRELYLHGVGLSEAVALAVAGSRTIETLELVFCDQLDRGAFMILGHMPSLRRLRVMSSSGATTDQAAIDQLRRARPELRIEFDG
jgi:hypothetical protein